MKQLIIIKMTLLDESYVDYFLEKFKDVKCFNSIGWSLSPIHLLVPRCNSNTLPVGIQFKINVQNPIDDIKSKYVFENELLRYYYHYSFWVNSNIFLDNFTLTSLEPLCLVYKTKIVTHLFNSRDV